MATSGTVGTTVFTTQQVIDHAFRRMGMPAELISGEKIETALENLWLLLQRLSNKGFFVWRIETLLMPLFPGLMSLAFTTDQLGIIKVLNANLRTMQRLTGTVTSSLGGTASAATDGNIQTACTQVGPDGSITIDLGQQSYITTMGVLPVANGTATLSFEVSNDNVNWVVFNQAVAETLAAYRWVWRDFASSRTTGGFTWRYARVRALSGTTLSIYEFFVGNTPQSIPMAIINKDDYFNLPDKNEMGRPTMLWQDIKLTGPVLRLWPTPNDQYSFSLVELQVQRQIQDVGTLTQQLDIPDRWFEAIVWSLAEMVADCDPDFKGDINRLERKAKELSSDAWGGVVATGPIYIRPNISPYTTGG